MGKFVKLFVPALFLLLRTIVALPSENLNVNVTTSSNVPNLDGSQKTELEDFLEEAIASRNGSENFGEVETPGLINGTQLLDSTQSSDGLFEGAQNVAQTFDGIQNSKELFDDTKNVSQAFNGTQNVTQTTENTQNATGLFDATKSESQAFDADQNVTAISKNGTQSFKSSRSLDGSFPPLNDIENDNQTNESASAPELGLLLSSRIEPELELDSELDPQPEALALHQSSLQSLLSSSSAEGLGGFLRSKGFKFPNFPNVPSGAFNLPTDPVEIQRLLSQLRQGSKSGRMTLDPVLLSELLAPYKKVEVVDNENENIWSPSNGPAKKPKGKRNRFSSKFRTTTTTTTPPPPETAPRPNISHVTDPNIRNHRLYELQSVESPDFSDEVYENYENFTHIDQNEDLLAQSSEIDHKVMTVVKPPPNFNLNPAAGNDWTPLDKRPVSMEGTRFDSAGDLDLSIEEPPFNLLRPREPLRESSTENLVFTHLTSEENKEREKDQKDRGDFRPSPKDRIGPSPSQNPPIFVDPDQDFFTSTIRAESSHSNSNEELRESELRLPPLLKKYLRARNRKKIGIGGSSEDRGVVDLEHDPRPYPPEDRGRRPNRKSDRILVNPGSLNLNLGAESEVHPYFEERERDRDRESLGDRDHRFRYQAFGPASNEGVEGHEHDEGGQGQFFVNNFPFQINPQQVQNQSPGKTGLILGHNGEQIYAGGYDHQFGHPFADEGSGQSQGDNQGSSSSSGGYLSSAASSLAGFAGGGEGSWSSTYLVLGGLIALSAITAFVLPTLLQGMGRNGKHRHDLTDENTEYYDDTTVSASSASNSNSPAPAPPQSSDPAQDSDLWSEIKGVYNDIVRIVRGDYGGIVDKLSSSSDKEKDPNGPNIVYRDDFKDDEVDEEEFEDYGKKRKRRKHSKLKNRKGEEQSPKNKKNKTLSTSLNYVVSSSSTKKTKDEDEYEETSRGNKIDINDTMATFYFKNPSSSLFSERTTAPAHAQDSFMGEWAQVQLIGN